MNDVLASPLIRSNFCRHDLVEFSPCHCDWNPEGHFWMVEDTDEPSYRYSLVGRDLQHMDSVTVNKSLLYEYEIKEWGFEFDLLNCKR